MFFIHFYFVVTAEGGERVSTVTLTPQHLNVPIAHKKVGNSVYLERKIPLGRTLLCCRLKSVGG